MSHSRICWRHSRACDQGELIRISSIQYTRACLASSKSCDSWLETPALRCGLVEGDENLFPFGPQRGVLPLLPGVLEIDHRWKTGLTRLAKGSVILNDQMTNSANWRLVVLLPLGGTTDRMRSLWKVARARFIRIAIEQVSATSRQKTWSRSIW